MQRRWIGSTCTLLGLVYFSGCGSRCESPTQGVGDFIWTDGSGSSMWPIGRQNKQPWFQGQPVTLKFDISITRRCAPPRNTIAAAVRVRDPGGTDVPVNLTASLEAEPNHFVTHAAFDFVPPRPGTYSIEASYEPGLRTDQTRELIVFQSAPSPRVPVRTFNRVCRSVQLTTAQTWLCDGDAVRGEEVVQTLPGALVVAGNVVWQVANGRLTRHVDNGSGPLASTPPAPLDVPDETVARLLPSPDDVVVVTTRSLARYTYDPIAGLTAAGRVNFTGAFAPSATSPAALRTVDRVYVGAATYNGLGGINGATVCGFQITSTGGLSPVAQPCQTYPEILIGADDQALWIGELTNIIVRDNPYLGSGGIGSLHRLVPAGDQVRLASRIFLPTTYQVGTYEGGRPGGVPWVSSAAVGLQLLARYANDVLYLEEFNLPTARLGASNSRFVLAYPRNVQETDVFMPQ